MLNANMWAVACAVSAAMFVVSIWIQTPIQHEGTKDTKKEIQSPIGTVNTD